MESMSLTKMLPEAIDRAAGILRTVRLRQELIDDLPEGCTPKTIEDAYAIQDRLVVLLGEDIAGWLVGCTNPEIQEQLGLREPYTARLLASSPFKSPAILQVPTALPVVLEVEFAFTLSEDIPRRATPYSEGEVSRAIRSVHPAIEMVLGHYHDWPSKDIYSLIADNGTDGALIVGEGVADWESLNLGEIPVTLSINGQVVREGAGSRILGGPLSVMTWLANHAERAPGLRAGHIINTGSCTSMYAAKRGDVAVADFGPLGAATLEIATVENGAY
jgi:2-keto-4-pentenoate hydratase